MLKCFAQDVDRLRRVHRDALAAAFQFFLGAAVAEPEADQLQDGVLQGASRRVRRQVDGRRVLAGEMATQYVKQIVADGILIVVEELALRLEIA
jgi:hypothetical protein